VGYSTLLLDLRYDHNHVVRHHPLAWIPVVFSAFMALVCLIALGHWERGGPELLLGLSAAGIVVGCVGFWLHSKGHPIAGIRMMLSVWAGQFPDPVKRPPVLAPFAFAGMGLLGIAACAARFRPRSTPD
jgi:hypothetical protein